MTRRARTFGAVAAAYERFRLGYPDDVAEAVVSHAGRPVRTALEIGAGTGKATRVFAARGVAVTATDPDAAMLAELRRRVPDTVTTVQAAFEELRLTMTYDVVYAAASLHWTDHVGRWDRVAALLEPGGVFASFGGPPYLTEPGLVEALRAALAPYLSDDDIPSPDGVAADAPLQWPGTELDASEHFDDVRQLVVARRLTMPATEYVGHLSTVSAYLLLDTATRERALAAATAALPPQVDVDADVTLHVARRVG